MAADGRLKVLLASNMYAYSGNWDKLDALGRFVDLAVITPEKWGVPELNQMLSVPQKARGCAVAPAPAAFVCLPEGQPVPFLLLTEGPRKGGRGRATGHRPCGTGTGKR